MQIDAGLWKRIQTLTMAFAFTTQRMPTPVGEPVSPTPRVQESTWIVTRRSAIYMDTGLVARTLETGPESLTMPTTKVAAEVSTKSNTCNFKTVLKKSKKIRVALTVAPYIFQWQFELMTSANRETSAEPTVNTVFMDKHCCSSVLMLRPYRLEQSSLICKHCWYFFSLVLGLSSRLIMFVRHFLPVRCPRLWYPYQVFRAL